MSNPSDNPPKKSLREIAKDLSFVLHCNCDLDNWEPEATTGHSCVCRIHKAAMSRFNSTWDGRTPIAARTSK